jgi:hypothetical protein
MDSTNAIVWLGLLIIATGWLVLVLRPREKKYWSGVRDIYDELEAIRVEKARADAHARVQQDRADEVALLEQMLQGEDR